MSCMCLAYMRLVGWLVVTRTHTHPIITRHRPQPYTRPTPPQKNTTAAAPPTTSRRSWARAPSPRAALPAAPRTRAPGASAVRFYECVVDWLGGWWSYRLSYCFTRSHALPTFHPFRPSTKHAGLITRSVLKALATEGVTTPHHARRFLLQQCRAVADEVIDD